MNFFSQTRNFKILERINEKARTKRIISFIIGAFLVAIAYNVFLASNDIVPGGVGGIAIILKDLFNFENSVTILVIGILLLIASYFTVGLEKTKGSIIGALLFPLLVELTKYINIWLEIDTSQMILSTVFGGVLYGFGTGMVFKAGFTTGGTDILKQIITKYLKVSIGKSGLICDGIIVLSSALVFGINNLLYSVVVLYIISIMSDKVILGISDSKAFYIITDKEEDIKEYILKSLNHGVTVFNAKGGFDKEKENVLMCVLPTKDYFKLKEGIRQIDKEAFFVVTDAYEVFGGE